MNQKAISVLEFNKVLRIISDYTMSVSGKEAILNTVPFTSIDIIRDELQLLEQLIALVCNTNSQINFNYSDITSLVFKSKVQSTLAMAELLKIGNFLKAAFITKKAVLNSEITEIDELKCMISKININNDLKDNIFNSIISDSEMSDNASMTLFRIRKAIKGKSLQIQNQINKFLNSKVYQDCLQDKFYTIRNDRYVLPVKVEYRSFIPGLIHDQSATGQTLYIEPMSIVELNNDLKSLQIEEENEINRILDEFTVKVSEESAEIIASYNIMTHFDILFAKANYAIKTKSIKPIINNKGIIEIKNGRHPLIDQQKVVPIDVHLGKEFDLLIITGPNTGGKTVTIKMVGLMTLMAMSGIFVLADSAHMSIFEEIYCDIGDEQSIEQSLSTFSSHISNIKNILDKFNDKSLILFDELGAGTDPREGSVLALSIVDFINNTGAKALITTHYNELKEYALVTNNIENASMEFDNITCSPTFRLIIGTPGFSNALYIAEKIGLNKNILSNAKRRLSKNDIDNEEVLKSIESIRINLQKQKELSDKELAKIDNDKKLIANELQNIKNLKSKLQEEGEAFSKNYVKDSIEEANSIINQLKELINNPSEQNLFKARKLKSDLTNFIKVPEPHMLSNEQCLNNSICIGSLVFIPSINKEGIVTEVKRNNVTVKLGSMSGVFPINFVILKDINFDNNSAKQENCVNIRKVFNDRAIKNEINLIGLSALEADHILNKYLSDAYASNIDTVKIIHGYGTGKLRKKVWEIVSNSSIVNNFREGEYGEGSNGVTIVTFKIK